MSASELLECAVELGRLLDRLEAVSSSAHTWGLRVLRRNIELAGARPETLATAANQIDFIEELAEAVWDGVDAGFRHADGPTGGWEQSLERERSRRAVVHRLDSIARRCCEAVERWHDELAAGSHDPAGP